MKMKMHRASQHNTFWFFILVFLIIFCVGFIGCSSNRITRDQAKDLVVGSLNDQPINPQSNLYVLQRGDIVKISIAEYPEFDTTVTVSNLGIISLKIVGDIQAAGNSRDQLASQLVLKLSDFVRTTIHPMVTIVNSSTQKIAILGAVARQDNFPISSDMPLLQVLALAGGVLPEADVQHIRIIRGGDPKNTVEIDLTQFLERGKSIEVPIIRAGDIVYVPREENVIRELSNFFRDAIFLFSFFAIAQ
jgi:polysaccharide export outer membrane protein